MRTRHVVFIVLVSAISALLSYNLLELTMDKPVEAFTWNEKREAISRAIYDSEYNITIRTIDAIMDYINKVNPKLDTAMKHRIALSIYKAHKEFGVPVYLISFIVARESTFNPFAMNSYKANGKRHKVYGLMQISDIHFSVIKDRFQINLPRDIFLPEVNIRVGTWILQQYLRIHGGNITKALNRYSGGMGKKYYNHHLYKLAIKTFNF